MRRNYFSLLTAIILLSLIFFSRLLPHPANFAPVCAVSLFSGYYFSKKRSIFLPLFGMLLSDLVLGFYQPMIMLSVYGSFVIIAIFGMILKQQKNFFNTLSLALSGSLLFFLVTNFAVWRWSGMYDISFSGLLLSYQMAIPFFKNTLAGDIFYTGVVFGVYECVRFFLARGSSCPKPEMKLSSWRLVKVG